MEMTKIEVNDLYSKLICALTHNINVCDKCQKCGINGEEVRINLVKELANYMGTDLPWVEENDKKIN